MNFSFQYFLKDDGNEHPKIIKQFQNAQSYILNTSRFCRTLYICKEIAEFFTYHFERVKKKPISLHIGGTSTEKISFKDHKRSGFEDLGVTINAKGFAWRYVFIHVELHATFRSMNDCTSLIAFNFSS